MFTIKKNHQFTTIERDPTDNYNVEVHHPKMFDKYIFANNISGFALSMIAVTVAPNAHLIPIIKYYEYGSYTYDSRQGNSYGGDNCRFTVNIYKTGTTGYIDLTIHSSVNAPGVLADIAILYY